MQVVCPKCRENEWARIAYRPKEKIDVILCHGCGWRGPYREMWCQDLTQWQIEGLEWFGLWDDVDWLALTVRERIGKRLSSRPRTMA